MMASREASNRFTNFVQERSIVEHRSSKFIDDNTRQSMARTSSGDESIRTNFTERPYFPDSPIRQWLADILISQETETVLGIIILLNLVLVVIETDNKASERSDSAFIEGAGRAFLSLYMCELATRVFVFRRDFIRSKWNLLDTVIVAIDLFLQSMSLARSVNNTTGSTPPSLNFLRILRIIRLTRAIRILIAFPELYMLLHGMFSAMRAIMWGAFLVSLMLIVWAILAVEIIHPLNLAIVETGYYVDCERCPRAYGSVWNSVLTFIQQLIAGDSWGLCTLPLLETYPALSFYFFTMILMIAMGMLNLILAVIVDRAAEARQEDLDHIVRIKEKEMKALKEKLLRLFETLDADNSGYLTLAELQEGFGRDKAFANYLKACNINEENLDDFFTIMDEDGSGYINYLEFVEKLYNMKHKDMRVVLDFLQYEVCQMGRTLASIADSLAATRVSNAVTEADKKVAPVIPKPEDAAVPKHVRALEEEQVCTASVSPEAVPTQHVVLSNGDVQSLRSSTTNLFHAELLALDGLTEELSEIMQRSLTQTEDDAALLKTLMSITACVPKLIGRCAKSLPATDGAAKSSLDGAPFPSDDLTAGRSSRFLALEHTSDPEPRTIPQPLLLMSPRH